MTRDKTNLFYWQPIETAPLDYTRILVCGGNCMGVEIAYGVPDFGIVCEKYDDRRISSDPPDRVTHWMPLPDAYEGGE